MPFLKRLALLIIVTLAIFLLGLLRGRNKYGPVEKPSVVVTPPQYQVTGGTGITPYPGSKRVTMGGVFETMHNLPTLIDQVKTQDPLPAVMDFYTRVFRDRGLDISVYPVPQQKAGIIAGFDPQTRELYTVTLHRYNGHTVAYPAVTRVPSRPEDIRPVMELSPDLPVPTGTHIFSRVTDGRMTSFTLNNGLDVRANAKFFMDKMTRQGWKAIRGKGQTRKLGFLFFQKGRQSCQIAIVGDQNSNGSFMMVHMTGTR